VRAWVIYSVVRVLVFAVPLGILMAIGFDWWIAALIAAAIGFCVSYIFLRPLRDQVATQLAESRSAATEASSRTDEDAEDAR
jgi:predicted MFS family arabinose efflux permease